MKLPHRYYLRILAALFSLWWIALAIHPLYRKPWLLENALVLAVVALLAWFHRRLLFSRVVLHLDFPERGRMIDDARPVVERQDAAER